MEFELATYECDDLYGLRPELVRLIEQHQIPGDPIVKCFNVRAEQKSGGCLDAIFDGLFGVLSIVMGNSPNNVHYWAHAITKRKVIKAHFADGNNDATYKGNVVSMNLIDIVNIEPDWYGNYLWPVAKVTGTGGATLDLEISSKARQMFIDVLQRAVDEAKSQMQQSQERPSLSERDVSPDVAKRLQNLTHLYTLKMITEEEYKERRKAILDQL